MSEEIHYLEKELYELVGKNPHFFKFLHSSSLDGIWFWDLENPEQEWMSPEFWRTLGYDPKKKRHLSAEWQDLIHPEDLERAKENLEAHCREENHPYDQVVRYTHKNGSTVWVRCRGTAIRNDQGRAVRLLGAHNDITAYMETKLRLEQRESKYRGLVEESDDLMTQVDLQGAILYINPASEKYFGLRPEECLGRSAFDFIHPDDREPTQRAFALWQKSQDRVFTYANRQMHRDGRFFYMQWSITLVKDQAGEVVWINSIARNITEQKLTKQALEKSEERYQFLFDTMYSGFALLKMVYNEKQEPTDYIFIEANRAHETLTGLKNQEIIGKRVLEVLPDLEPYWIEQYGEVARTGERLDLENWVESLGRWYQVIAYSPQKGYVAVNFIDITERKIVELRKEEQERELRDVNFKFHLASDAAGIGLWDWNAHTGALGWDENMFRLYGIRPEEFDRTLDSWRRRVHPEDKEEAEELLNRAFRQGEKLETTFRIFTPEGELRYMKAFARVRSDREGRPLEMVGVNYDITRVKLAEQSLLRSSEELEKRVSQRTGELSVAIDKLAEETKEKKSVQWQLSLASEIFKHSVEGIIITDETGVILDVNKAFTTITRYEREEALGRKPRLLKSDRHDRKFYKQMWRSLLEQDFWEGDIWNRKKSGEIYPERLSISSVRNGEGKVSNFVAVFHDITDAKASEEKILYQAYHDALTGLPNRALLYDRAEKAMAHARRRNRKVVFFFIDLDNFKNINDSLGHLAGDQLLHEVAERLLKLFRREDTVARLGGDEFVIMANHVVDYTAIAGMAQNIIDAFAAPFVIDGHELFVTPSIGISCYPDNGETPEALLKNADTAMYTAKDNGKNGFSLFTKEMNRQVTNRLSLENKLRRAVEQQEFAVYYQPKVEIASGRIYGLEALVRWRQADGKMISPGDFIPLAEETGLIIPLGEWVTEEACSFLRELNRGGYPDLVMSVNLSPNQFYQENLTGKLLDLIARTGASPSRVELEITESTVMKDMNETIRILSDLKAAGAKLSIDDFGTGYSSLAYLKHFPIDVLKIDKSFVSHLPGDQSDEMITRTIQTLAGNFGLQTVAEGVETREQLDFLRGIGCFAFQGYYCSPPVPREEVLALLKGCETA